MKLTIKYLLIILLLQFSFTACEEEITEIEPVEIAYEVQNVSSFGEDDGAIDISVTGGQPPFRYFWSNGEVSEDVQNLKAGTYTIRLVYAGAGVAETEITVEEPAPNPLELDFQVQDVSTYASSDGSIQLTVSGGVPPYTYAWSNGANGPILKELLPGEYTVTVTDSNPHVPVTTTGTVEVERPAFICGQDSVRDVDGNKYPTVQMGDQCWTAENLRVIHTPESSPGNMIEIEGRHCFANNCNSREGAHYTWNAAMNGSSAATGEEEVQGICPDGWHMPTLAMWQEMEDFLKIAGNGGEGTNVPDKLRGADSPSGFDGIYAEAWGYDPVPSDEYAGWWAANEFVPGNAGEGFVAKQAYFRALNELSIFQRGSTEKSLGLSVRCVKND